MNDVNIGAYDAIFLTSLINFYLVSVLHAVIVLQIFQELNYLGNFSFYQTQTWLK